MDMERCLGTSRTSWPSKTNSCQSYSKGKVRSLLRALESPYTPEKNFTYQNHIWTETFVTKIFCRTPPSRGYSSDFSHFYKFLLRDPLVGWVAQKIFSNKSFSPYMVLVSKFFFVGMGWFQGSQEASDHPLAVALTGTGFAWPGGPGSAQTPLHIHFFTKRDMSHGVKF